MSTCRWCTPGGSVTAELLKSYAVKELPNEDCIGANDDLSYCMECVVEYHKARDEVPQLHKSLWPLETSRLIAQLENAMREEIEDDDELYLIEDDGEKQLFGYGGCSFESDVRVPLLEILKFPYLLLDKRISELSVEALCKMEQVNNTFQVYEKLPGVYLLLVHPNEMIRHWAILTARAQGKVDRDDYYDLEEVFTCLFKVIELGLFENSDIYMYTEVEDGKLILLPSHLYDTSNYKNYWLGICMLLTVLEEQAMASLLLGPNKQNDFMQSILHIMEKQTEDESINPFWPALHCFMTILDRLGSKVWGQLIDPIQAFQTIIASPSYNSEIENIRKSCRRTTKCEPDSGDDDIVTCSQAVYSFNTEKVKKEAGWKSAICPDYCPNMYEDMQSLANILQSDIGQDMRVHNSTFLWFIPYVQSVMDLKDLGVAYIMEVIHHLSSEIKVVFTQGSNQCDKVTEFFVRVLVSVIELHRSKKCLHFLYISSHKWVEAIVKCSLLPVKSPRITLASALSSSPTSQTPSSVQFACMQLIRSLLREGYPLGQQAACKQYLDKFNLIIRGSVLGNLDLSKSEVQGLQTCLTQIIKNIKDKESSVPSSPADPNPASLAQAVPFIKTERMDDECYGASITCPYSSDVPVYPLERREVLKFQMKKEPPDKKKDVGYNSSGPSCSSRFKTQIKNEKLDDISTLISAQEEPKKLLKGWQSKLSEVMAKVPNLKPNATSAETESKISTIEGSTKPAQKPCYATIEEQKDLLLKVKSDGKESESDDLNDRDHKPLTWFLKNHLDKSQQSVTDNIPVSEQLQRLSLDNNPAGQPIKKEFQGVAELSSSSFLESNTDCIMDSETDDDALPLTLVKKKLLMKSSKKSALASTKMNCNSDHTAVVAQTKGSNFLDDSIRQACDVPDFCSIQRKVIGASRALGDENVSSKTELSDHIITISDDSDQEEEPFCKSVKIEKQDTGQDTKESPIQRTEQVQCEPVDPSFDEYGSQVFEFETQDDIYSAWSDSQLEEKKPNVQENISSWPETSNTENFDQDNDLNQWGYDTDYVSDEIIEKAAEDAEQQFKALTSTANIKSGREHGGNKSPHEAVNSSVSFGKRSHGFVADVDVKSKQTKLAKEPFSLHAKSRNTEAPAMQKKALTAKTNKNPLKAQRPIQKNESPKKASLAVVPPKKIHKCPEPTSTVEKLRLKKAPRKALDLSQRSLDSLAELRNHGKSAGIMETKKSKSKLISPQSILAQRNKKLLACQERQFYQQSRPKDSEKRKLSSSPKNSSKNAGMPTKQSGNGSRDRTSLPGQRIRAEKMKRPQKEEPQGRGLVDVNKLYTSSSETRKDAESGSHPVVKLAPQSNPLGEDNAQSTMPVTAANTNHKNDDEEEDDLFLTQADPLDMDLCSQLETEINVGTLQDLCTSGVVDYSPSVHQVTEGSKCSPKDCTEFVPVSSDNYPINSVPEKKDDHVFARPGLPPSLQKPLRPVTAKVYSTGTTSRTASLTKDLESLPKPLPNVKAKTPSSKPSVPRPTMQPPAQSKAPVLQTTSNVLKPLINQNTIPLQCSFNSVRGTGMNSLAAIRTPQRDQNWLVREVLHWSFELFDNISQFGVSKKLCQLPLLKVRLEFSGYEEYFNTICPLMLLNTFESLAQEWTVKQPALASHLCKLHLQNFCKESQMNRGEFQVWIRNVDLNMQWLPKEGDLVFLLVPESTGSSPREESDLQGPPHYHTGHVSRFVRTHYTQAFEKEQYTLCELSIHTYGNLLSYCKQQVRCAVIGSLITTQRQFKALIQLQRNPLFKPIIHPTPNDFLPRDKLENYDNLVPISKEYNSDQRNAIEKACAMITQHPRLPRICIIHGPPGTGKSKTIVGLLYRILMEKQNNVPDLSFSAKNKRNRVLVCAPSNAALDDLMKKIILEFKEKCRDKKNTLGNCGDINLVRLGSEKTISSDVVKFSLDCQVNYRIKRASQDPSVLKQKEALDRQLDELSRQRAMERCSKNTCEELDQRIARLTKERQCVANVLNEERRRPQEVQRNIILESHVICCTLSTSGGILLESAFRQLGQEPFGCVIVDEAGQSCEVETLIPLLHRCCKLVLVGDPEQLPPTVISMKAEELGYGQSLMSRLCQILVASGTNTPILQLTKQYRMHPDICLFPSKHFYNSVLRTDRAIEEVRCSSDWPFQPYMVFDVSDGFEIKEKESFSNPLEIKMVVALIKLIKSKKKEFGFRNIGIITPYRAQKMKIINELKKTFGDNAMPGEVDTVDGFQGRQKDCIIVTCVRANSIQGCIGFLASKQRLNVTITRAKFSLFILGSLRTLIENKDWNHLIQDAQRRGALVKTKQEHYQRDVNRILKLNPVIQRSASCPPTKPVEVHKGGSPYTPLLEAPGRGNNNPPVSGGPPHKRTIAHPAVNVGRVYNRSSSVPQVSERNVSSNMGPPAIPLASSGNLRDPRLARRREETRSNNTTPSGLQQSSDTNRSQSHSYQHFPSSSVAGVKRPSQSSGGHPWSGQPRNEGLDRDYRSGKDQEPKKRKVS